MSLRVALIDDHQAFRERLRALLVVDPDIEIVAEAASGQEILDLAQTTGMDAACMDISMPGMSGIEATRRLLAIDAKVRVIGLSAYADQHYVEAMLEAGAVGFFTKAEAGDGLLQAIRSATPERPCFSADVAAPIAANAAPEASPVPTPPTPATAEGATLGPMEREVLLRVAQGLTLPQIADSLSMDPTMVEVYRRNIMRKLHLKDEAALADYARRIGPGTA